jgi:hypothetical protein
LCDNMVPLLSMRILHRIPGVVYSGNLIWR